LVTLDVADDVFVDAVELDVVAVLAEVVGLALPVGAVPLPVQEIIPGKIKQLKTNREISFFTIYPLCIDDRSHLIEVSNHLCAIRNLFIG
jgi:hypothetical protein